MKELAITRTPSACDASLLIGGILDHGVANAPKQQIVYGDRVRYTYTKLGERVARLASALRRDDPLDGNWQPLPAGESLPELGVSDQRYVLYRSRCSLAVDDAAKLTKLLVNSFSRDIVSAQINGHLARRLYPSDAYAAAATRDTKKSFARIRDLFSGIYLYAHQYSAVALWQSIRLLTEGL